MTSTPQWAADDVVHLDRVDAINMLRDVQEGSVIRVEEMESPEPPIRPEPIWVIL